MKNQYPERFYILDILRGFAALAVVLFHYRVFYANNVSLNQIIVNQQPLYNIFFLAYDHGWIAVQFFFTLSGFIFYNFYLNKISNNQINFKNFFILRFSRLYPLHLLTLILITLIIFANIGNYGFQNIDNFHFLLNIFLIQSWGFENGSSYNEPSWSISIEILMYSIFFLVSLRKKFIFFNTIFIIAVSSLIFFKFKLLGYGGFCFYVGGMTYLVYDKIKNKLITENKKNNINYMLFFVLQIFLAIFIIKKFNFSSIELKIILLLYFFPLIILTSIILQQYKILIINKISKIGDISYSIYMIHFVIQAYVISILSYLNIVVNFNSLLIFCNYVLFLIIFSYCSNRYFEKPMQKYIRKRLLS